MKIACTSFSFDRDIREAKMTLRDFFEFCRAEEIEGVELWDLHLPEEPSQEDISEIGRALQVFGLPLVTIAVNNHEFTSTHGEERARDIAKVKHWIDVVADLGCSVLRVLPGDLKLLNTYPAERYPLVRAAIEQCLEQAQRRGVILAVENCPREARAEAVVELVKDLNTPLLRTCPDIGNLPHAGRYQVWEELLPYAAHVHVKTFHFDDQGEETTIDYARTMNALRECRFQGYVSVEYEGDGDEATGVRKSIALIHRYINC